MVRGFAYIVTGWALIAIVGGLADVMSLTVMLPATSAVVVTHAAFSRGFTAPGALAVAIGLGYIEDLHQGAPVGTLALAHGLTLLVLRWTSARFSLGTWLLRGLAAVVAVVMIDLLTFGTLAVMSEALELRREALWPALGALRWHALATLLVAPPCWALLERVLAAFRVSDERPAPPTWGHR